MQKAMLVPYILAINDSGYKACGRKTQVFCESGTHNNFEAS